MIAIAIAVGRYIPANIYRLHKPKIWERDLLKTCAPPPPAPPLTPTACSEYPASEYAWEGALSCHTRVPPWVRGGGEGEAYSEGTISK